MRVGVAALALIACGNSSSKPLDSGLVSDAPALACTPTAGTNITFRLITTVRGPALLATSPPNDPRVFIVEMVGEIRILTDDTLVPTPFLDLTDEVVCCGEQGLLGLAFHPDYANNGTFFVYYTTGNANIVERFQVSSDPNRADKATRSIVLSIPDFASNHNGGMIEFGPDGYLYIGTGDGGGGGDPQANGQNQNTLLGKILRIDVDAREGGNQYGIPPTNPYAAGGGAPEVFILGLRNPWRWSFDRVTGDLWIGDVGQETIEELTFLPAGMQAGANLGWNMYEGDRCYDGPCNPANKIMPQFQKTHADGWASLIGGSVYRGSCYPNLVGTYFFTDYYKHALGTAKLVAGNPVFDFPATRFVNPPGDPLNGMPTTPSSIHADSRGELYLTTTECCGTALLGGVYHLEAGP